MSLSCLAEDVVGIQMDKSHRIRCSDWEAEELSPAQVSDPTGQVTTIDNLVDFSKKLFNIFIQNNLEDFSRKLFNIFSDFQIDYAALDAMVAADILTHLVVDKLGPSETSALSFNKKLTAIVQGIVDVVFQEKRGKVRRKSLKI